MRITAGAIASIQEISPRRLLYLYDVPTLHGLYLDVKKVR